MMMEALMWNIIEQPEPVMHICGKLNYLLPLGEERPSAREM